MNRMAYRLRDKCIEVISRPQYQPGVKDSNGHPTTWCNEAANAILIEMGFDTKPILNPKGIGWTGATAMFDNALAMSQRPLSGVLEVIGRLAQALANIGIPILIDARDVTPEDGTISHVGIVCPDDAPYDETRGPFVIQAGAHNGARYAINSFPGLEPKLGRCFLLPPKVE